MDQNIHNGKGQNWTCLQFKVSWKQFYSYSLFFKLIYKEKAFLTARDFFLPQI